MGFWQGLPIHSINTYWMPVTWFNPGNATWIRRDWCPPGLQKPAEGETHMCVNDCSSLGKSGIAACKYEYSGEELNSLRTLEFSPGQWYLCWALNRDLAWRIPWTEEPGRLQSMGSQRVRHAWATKKTFFFCNREGRLDWLISRKKSIPGWAGGQRGEQDSMFGQYCVF